MPGGEIHVLVAGANAAEAAKAAAQAAGVAKTLHADASQLGEFLAENVAALVVSIAKGYTHVLAPATSNGKNVMPRVAALLDVQQISEIVAVEGADTFVRPIYAGNALATVKYTAPIKVMTIRTTAFEKANALDKLEGFASHFGADFYGLPRNTATITLKKNDWRVPDSYPVNTDQLVPLQAGEILIWQLAD